jgi:hypothetical protein
MTCCNYCVAKTMAIAAGLARPAVKRFKNGLQLFFPYSRSLILNGDQQ